MKKSAKTHVTPTERVQLIGLLTLAKAHTETLKSIEAAVLGLVEEIDEKGSRYRVWGGGFVNDTMAGSHNFDADELLALLDLPVVDDKAAQ